MSYRDLPGIPAGSVPKQIRESAEVYIRGMIRLAGEKEDLKLREEKLMLEMAKAAVPVAVVVLDNYKYMVRLEPGKTKIKVKAAELAPTAASNGKP